PRDLPSFPTRRSSDLVKEPLSPFLPAPAIEKEGEAFRLRHDLPHSIGKIRSFQGNFGMHVRAYAYIRTMGPDGLREAGETAILKDRKSTRLNSSHVSI